MKFVFFFFLKNKNIYIFVILERRLIRIDLLTVRKRSAMSIRVSGGVYLVPTAGLQENEKSDGNVNNESNNQQQTGQQQQQQALQQHNHNHQGKTVTIVAGPQRSNSLDYLNFEEKRQLIASSLSLSDFLAHGPAAAAAAAAKEVAASTVVIGESRGKILFRRLATKQIRRYCFYLREPRITR